MLDERDYFSRFVNALLESIERYLHNPKSISEEEIQHDLTKVSAYFEKEYQINLLSIIYKAFIFSNNQKKLH